MKYLVATLILLGLFSPAEARQRHAQPLDPGCNIIFPCTPMAGQRVVGSSLFDGIRSIKVTMRRDKIAPARSVHTTERRVSAPVIPTATPAKATVVEHPAGCPRSAFCGCGAAVRLFGHPIRSLYLAANWLLFPHVHSSMAQGGMVAARRHHVMVLESHVEGDTWIVYDANSGGHATRIHARSIAGYTVVQPRG